MNNPQQKSPTTAMDFVDLGIGLQKRGNHLEAIRAYAKALKIDSNSHQSYAEWGNLLMRRKKYWRAARKYLSAIRIEPDAVDFRFWVRALDQLTETQVKKLRADLEEFAEGPVSYAVAYLNWARELAKKRRYDEAEPLFQKATRLQRNAAEAFSEWGDALYLSSDYESAISRYLDALDAGANLDYARWVEVFEKVDNSTRLSSESRFQEIVRAQQKLIFYVYWADELIKAKRYTAAYDRYNQAGREALVYGHWAKALHGQKNYEAALMRYQEAIALDPTTIDYGVLVNALARTGKQVARNWADGYRSIAENEKNAARALYADGYRRWGDALAAGGSYREAFKQYEASIGLNPAAAETYASWGSTLHALGRNEEAGRKFQQAAEGTGVTARMFANWGDLLLAQKDHSGALNKYLQAIKLDQASLNYSNWVTAFVKSSNAVRESIVKEIERLAMNDVSFALCYSNWGSAFSLTGDYRAAVDQFRRATEVDGNFLEAYVGWGDAQSQAGEWAEAVMKYQKVVEGKLEEFDYTKWVKALDHLAAGAKERVIRRFDDIALADHKFASIYNLWGNALYKLNKKEEALAVYQKALDVDRDYENVYFNCGLSLNWLDRYDEAIERYEQALDIDPDMADAYFTAGNSLESLSQYQRAIERYQKAVDLNPSNIDYYIGWALALIGSKSYQAALQKCQEAAELDPSTPKAYFLWGNALAEMGRYEDAYEKFRQAIKAAGDEVDATYAVNNIGDYLYQQGRYELGRLAWEQARVAYARSTRQALERLDADYFHYYGVMLQTVFNETDEAERMYREGLKVNPNHVGILTQLVTMYIDLKDETANPSRAAEWYWKARESYQRAEMILSNQPEGTEKTGTLLRSGQLRLALGDYMTQSEMDLAEDALKKALARNPNSADICTNLGVLYARKKDFKNAMRYFSDSLLNKPGNLNVWSNLAEVYLKSAIAEDSPDTKGSRGSGDGRRKETAEKEFRLILEVAPTHVESLIGLGEVYKAMGEDTKDEDLFARAIDCFRDAVRFADSYAGSKRLKKKELAAAYYSIGYCKVKLYEASKKIKDESLLREAQDYFTMSADKDPGNYNAKLALEKLDKRLAFSSQRFVERMGPWLILSTAGFLFFVAQIGILWRSHGQSTEWGYYALLSFASLLFLVVGLYLPQLLKLKVGGIELQKSAVDQIATPDNLGINK